MQNEDSLVIKPTRKSKLFEKPKIKYIKEDKFLKILEEALKKTERWVEPVPHFRASGLKQAFDCARATVFDRMGHRELFKPSTLRIFRMGNAVEGSVVQQFQDAKVFWAEQIPIWFRINRVCVKGTLDVIVEKDGVANLVEIKSMKDSVFERLPKAHDYTPAGDSTLRTQHLGYILQWNIYAAASGIHRGCLFIENKDTSEQVAFWLEFDPVLLNETVETLEKIADFRKGKREWTLPAIPEQRNPRGNDFACDWCAHRYLCVRAKDGMNRKQLIKLERKIHESN